MFRKVAVIMPNKPSITGTTHVLIFHSLPVFLHRSWYLTIPFFSFSAISASLGIGTLQMIHRLSFVSSTSVFGLWAWIYRSVWIKKTQSDFTSAFSMTSSGIWSYHLSSSIAVSLEILNLHHFTEFMTHCLFLCSTHSAEWGHILFLNFGLECICPQCLILSYSPWPALSDAWTSHEVA